MLRSCRPLVAGLVLAAGLTIGRPAVPVVAQTGPLFPSSVMAVPVGGVVGIAVPPIVVTVPPLGLATRHAHVDKARSHTERADITIGGE